MRAAPVGVIVGAAVTAIAHAKNQALRTGQVNRKQLWLVAAVHHAGLRGSFAVHNDAKGDGRRTGFDFIVHAHHRREARRVAAERHAKFAVSVRADPVRIDQSAQC